MPGQSAAGTLAGAEPTADRPRAARALAGLLLALAPLAAGGITAVSTPPTDGVLIDTRPVPDCAAGSFAGARCLPPEEFLDPAGRLVGFRDVHWLLGTAGLAGTEAVVVAGDDPGRRAFVAAVLYIAGQAVVQVLDGSLAAHLDETRAEPGRVRGILRDPVYVAAVRDRHLVLGGELERALAAPAPPLLLDGRGRPGERPGLPGARHWPADGTGAPEVGHGSLPVAYAEGAYESLVYFARLLLAQGLETRVYVPGLRGWQVRESVRAGERMAGDAGAWRATGLGLLAVAAVLAVAGVMVGRRRWN